MPTPTSQLGASKAALGFESLPWGFSVDGAELKAQGRLPSWLAGSLYRNGPGLYPKVSRPHWFDGFAYLQGFHFSRGAVKYYTRFVGSSDYNNSKPTPEDPCKIVLGPVQADFVAEKEGEGAPNTGVTINEVGGRLLTNTADLLSNQFDGVDLSNVATPFNYPDNIPPLASPEHRQVDPHGNLFHFGYIFGQDPAYLLYWIPAGTVERKVLGNASVNPRVGQPSYQHSYCLTENFLVMSDVPVPFPAQDFSWTNFKMVPGVPTTWRAFNRTTGLETFNWTSPAFFVFHHINCYEDPRINSIVADLITYPNTDIIPDLYLDVLINTPRKTVTAAWDAHPQRYLLPLHLPGETVRPTELSTHPAELPTINYNKHNTRLYSFFYAISLSSPNAEFFDQLIKVNTHSRSSSDAKVWREPNTYPGEPIFVPTPNAHREDDGVVLSVVLNPPAKNSFLVVLNATTFTEIARVNTPHYAPFGFHGLYTAHTPK